MMGEVNVHDALERLSSSAQKERTEGLADLKHVLTHNRHSSKINRISDKTFHSIYEGLFRAVAVERSAYIKATKNNPKRNQAASRLAEYASTLRFAVEIGVRNVKLKTVQALADHIVQTLPFAGEVYCEPLSLDYIKALRTTFEYEPHVEHLSKDLWSSVVDFCLEGIGHLHDDESNTNSRAGNGGSEAASLDASRTRSSGSSGRNMSGRKAAFPDGKKMLEELLVTLRLLTRAPNAPLLDPAQNILKSLFDLLEHGNFSIMANQDALKSINCILRRISFELTGAVEVAARRIVPWIRRFWPTKGSSLKEEMLISLVQVMPKAISMIRSPNEDAFRQEVDLMLEALSGEYSRRLEKDQLQVDDIILRCRVSSGPDEHVMGTNAFQFRTGRLRSESHWVLLSTIAQYSAALDGARLIAQLQPRRSENGSSKKLRTTTDLEDYLGKLSAPQLSVRICAVQIISFLVQERSLGDDELSAVLERLIMCASDENSSISGWALIGISSCAFQSRSHSTTLASQWSIVWQLASRYVPAVSLCSAACHLLDVLLRLKLVPFASISDVAEGMTASFDLNGPANVSESSCSLWLTILEQRLIEHPGGFNDTAERILHWIFSKWNPSNFIDKLYAFQSSQVCTPHDVLQLFYACIDQPRQVDHGLQLVVLGPVARACLFTKTTQGPTDYILLSEPPKQSTPSDGVSLPPRDLSSTGQGHLALEHSVLDFCNAEIEKSDQRLREWSIQRPQQVNVGMIRILTSLCIVSSAIANDSAVGDRSKRDALSRRTDAFSELLAGFVGQPDFEQEKVDAVLEIMASCLPDLTKQSLHTPELFSRSGLIPLSLHISGALTARSQEQDINVTEKDFDLMDLEGNFETQNSRSRSNQNDSESGWSNQGARSDIRSLRQSVAAYLKLIHSKHRTYVGTDAPLSLPSSFVDYLTSLSTGDLLACRPFLSCLLSAPLTIAFEDAEQLLEHLGSQILRPYEFERSELALGMVVEVMVGLAHLWTDLDSGTLYENAFDIYQWFTDVALKLNFLSSSVLVNVADMLQKLLQIQPDYGQEASMPSVRTMLFRILRDGDLLVKWHIAEHLSTVFRLFSLKNHDSVFDDVHDSLPNTRDWKEGIAMRLFILSELASSWPTLLRRCVYLIFETAGEVRGSVSHAARCLLRIATALRLESPASIFRLFAPQLIYTWLESQSLSKIPFAVFEYNTLAEMLLDVQEEVVGQVIMRSMEGELTTLASMFNVRVNDLIERAFAKSAAYCIAWDTGVAGATVKGALGSEASMRSRLGKEHYAASIRLHFPRIIAFFFLMIEHEDQIERAFQKRPIYDSAASALKEMKAISSSTDSLPPGQQPSFSAKYLLDQVERLCRRTLQKPDGIWTPGLFTFVLRNLISSTDSSLGSLHACSVIRKLRVLVAIAGDVAFQCYGTEAILHALRPFLTDRHCAEDAIGLAQFILSHAKPYLHTNLSFVASLAVSTLISLKAFLYLQSQTKTHESQHTVMIKKVQAFHSWFANFCPTLDGGETSDIALTQSLNLSDRNEAENSSPFLSIVRPACEVGGDGDATIGTPESRLLIGILDDEMSSQSVLNAQSRSLAVGLISRKFTVPQSFQDDIMGPDHMAQKYAGPALRSCLHAETSNDYLLWVGKLVGRAHNSKGHLHLSLDRLSLGRKLHQATIESTLWSASHLAIITAISSLLSSDDPHHVSTGEETLSSILARIASTTEASTFDAVIRPEVATALSVHIPDVKQKARNLALQSLQESLILHKYRNVSAWIRDFATALANTAPDDAILGALPRLLMGTSELSEVLLPYVLHLVLAQEYGENRTIQRIVSEACRICFRECDERTTPFARVLLQSILYLRTQAVPGESTLVDRENWVEVDLLQVAEAAVKCSMHTTGLLYVELHANRCISNSRRSSAATQSPMPVELLTKIYQSLDEPDSYYGMQQQSDLTSVLDRLDYEGHGFKGLLFRGAQLDSRIRRSGRITAGDAEGTLNSLSLLNLSSLTHALSTNQQFRDLEGKSIDRIVKTARKLEQWDVKAPESISEETGTVFRAFQGLSRATDLISARQVIERGLLDVMRKLLRPNVANEIERRCIRALGVLSEIDEVVSSRSKEEFYSTWSNMKLRQGWMLSGKFEDAESVLSSRETLFSCLSRNTDLRSLLNISLGDSRLVEAEAVLASATVSRRHDSLQHALASVTYLSDLVPCCSEVGVNIRAAAQNEVAAVLWEEGEYVASIRILQELDATSDLERQSVPVGRSGLLAHLGHHVAEARLEKPEDIIRKYLLKAIKELKGNTQGDQAGEVFHEFASFCDRQLQNPDNLEDFSRMQKLRERKKNEVSELQVMLHNARSSDEKKTLRVNYDRAKQWLNIDNQEYQRLYHIREAFLQQSLENYLLSLQADEAHDVDVLRFFALWIENSDMPHANAAVKRYIGRVPSRKFASLMNQLSSRLQSSNSEFHALLAGLVFRICVDHPYHGMYHIYAGARTTGGKDETAQSRHAAAMEISNAMRNDSVAKRYWIAIHDVHNWYHELCNFKSGPFKAGREYQLDNFPPSKKILGRVPVVKIPPATMSIPLRPSCDYSDVPKITGWKSKMTIASGVSAPKILTAIASDGLPYKQLFKGGSDDLRQDTIMEQVFDQVTAFLGNHKATRERHLHVRTYKIVPLSAGTGIIEFVRNTIPLNNFLMPAHERYYPRDLKPTLCREKINNVASLTSEVRLKTFRNVMENFHPIGRYFFLERFPDPDEWFQRRLAYTRSTAAISMLGYVLGLGDRHCQNILLDEKSGEVVHIDLGVAFEAGRVLPIPELVPFRLTRDLVDAMGITKTEGVFRRCCEFVMDALREERENIMTLLNVLRYDPLYSWSVSPLKAKRMQEAQDGMGGQNGAELVVEADKRKDDDSGEAGRALAVVEKKLSKSLSTTATVNELIQQATDEMNLALLYSGWAAYA